MSGPDHAQPTAGTPQGYAPQPQHPRPPMAQESQPPTPQGYYQPSPGGYPAQQQQQAYPQLPYQQAPAYGSPAPSAGVPYTNPQGVQQVYAPRPPPQQPYYQPPPQLLQQQVKRPAPQARAPAQGPSRSAPQQPAYPQTTYLPPQHVIPPKQQHRDPHRYATLPAPAPLPAYTIQGQAGQAPSAAGATSAGPLPLFAPITNPRNRNAQACFTSYASRLRTGVSLLMQPILASSAPAQGNGAGSSLAPQSGRRRGAVNYAENDKDVTDESESESDSAAESDESKEVADGNYGGRVGRTAVKSKKIAGPPVKGGMGSAGTKGSGLDRSYLGELPPVEKIVVKPAQKTRHAYHPTEVLEAAAKEKETLVPVRIDIDTETHRIRDAFLWNINESLSTPEEFAQIFCQDLELPAGTHAAHVAAQIRAQLDEYKGVAEMDVEYTGEHVPVDEEDEAAENGQPARADDDEDQEVEPQQEVAPPLTEDISIVVDPPAEDATATPLVKDYAGADIEGARKRKREDGDEGEGEGEGEGEDDEETEAEAEEEVEQEEEVVIDENVQESDCRIIVNLDVQLSNYSLRDRIEWDLSSPLLPASFAASLCADLGLPSSALPLLTHAIHEELLRHKKDCLELGFVGAGWSLGQGKTQGGKIVGPRGLEGAWRGWEEGSEFEPVLREVDEEEMEKREAERERSSRRMRRETARFTTSSGNRRRR